MKKYKVIKSVRHQGKDLSVGEVIELSEGSEEYINLVQAKAIVLFGEENKEEIPEKTKSKK